MCVLEGRGSNCYCLCTFYSYVSGQIIATSHDLTPNGGLVREIPLIQGKSGLVKYYNLASMFERWSPSQQSTVKLEDSILRSLATGGIVNDLKWVAYHFPTKKRRRGANGCKKGKRGWAVWQVNLFEIRWKNLRRLLNSKHQNKNKLLIFANNFHQLYPWNQPARCLKKWYTIYVFQASNFDDSGA